MQAAWSAGVGGGISILATLFFALRAIGLGGEAPVKTLVGRFYVAEGQKLLLTAVLFYVTIRWLDVTFLPMMVAFAVTLMVFWVALLPALSGSQD
jgi:ATP synthase protein I